MLKITTRLFAVIACLISMFLVGCSDDTAIMLEQPESKPAPEEEVSVEETTTTDGGVGGWWGIRQVKGVFKGDAEKGSPPKHPVDGGNTAAGDEEEYIEEEEVVVKHQDRWRDPADDDKDPDFEFAMVKINEANYSEAKHLLLNVAKRKPNSSTVWRWLGECHYNLMELEEAIQAFQKSLEIYPENYFAMRGEGFSHIHLGHEMWRSGQRDQAHEQYRKAMKLLQNCTRIYPADLEAMYGRSMAAEGASRRLYQNAIVLLRQGKREAAESEARNCLEVIDEGIEAARQRIYKNAEEIGPRNIAGGLFQRRAMLQKAFGRLEEAIKDMESAVEAYESIQKIEPNNYLAGAELTKCKKLLEKWEEEFDKQPAPM